ncbi:MAG TPA: zinc ABC transporter substrate-binding protein [Bacteroidales bacterium]|nr:zinc ABC transporter substrate-binding protein [Bacteroidales bacterium]
MRKEFLFLILLSLLSCKPNTFSTDKGLITVSIAPFGFFVEKIGGGDFIVNVMVPEGADPHVYEPAPAQVAALRKSSAYISDGYLDFELAWLDKFYSVNPSMKKLKLADSVELINEETEVNEGIMLYADPHFWVAPLSGLKIAESVKSLLCELKPDSCEKYTLNFHAVEDSIFKIHKRASELFAPFAGHSFVVFHHTLAYIAKDYNLIQVSIEKEGKEPSPGWLREVIDMAKKNRTGVILIQKEYDTRNARVVASESGAGIREIRPLSADWYGAVNDIIDAIYESFTASDSKK